MASPVTNLGSLSGPAAAEALNRLSPKSVDSGKPESEMSFEVVDAAAEAVLGGQGDASAQAKPIEGAVKAPSRFSRVSSAVKDAAKIFYYNHLYGVFSRPVAYKALDSSSEGGFDPLDGSYVAVDDPGA